jgi:signal transduction histidine kinase
LRVNGGGDFQEGLDAEWFRSLVQDQQRDVLVKWSWLLSVVLIAEIGAVWAITYLVRALRGLRLAVQRGFQHRRRELAQIGSGLAHEIRNPLHTLRINLHLLRRSLGGHSPLAEDERAATLQDCEGAIERLVALMQDLVHFSHPHEAEPSQIDLGREVQATLNLLTEDLRRAPIEIHTQLTGEPAEVAIDPARLRHLVLALITFARQRAGKEGTVEIDLHRDGTQAVLAVADSGPSLTAEEQARIFEPFQAPAAVGSGLGLALVQVYAEQAGGQVTCLQRQPAGTRFCLSLPLVPSASQESRRDTQA